MAIYYIGFPLLIIAAVFDSTIMTLFRFWGGAPSMVLLIVVSWALLVELPEVLPWAMIGGIMRDLLSVAPVGSSALILILIVVVIDQFLPKLSWRNVPVPPLVVAAASVVYDVYMFLMLFLIGHPLPNIQDLFYVIIPGILANLLLILFVFRTLGGINNFLRPPRASAFE